MDSPSAHQDPGSVPRPQVDQRALANRHLHRAGRLSSTVVRPDPGVIPSLGMTVNSCAYCGGPHATTRDHVPPKCIFPSPAPSGLVTVRACEACNQGASADDEYFRDVIVRYHRVADQPAAAPILESMLRAAGRPEKQAYAEATLASFRLIDLETSAGIYLDRRLATVASGQRLERAAIRYVRGLYRHEIGEPLPATSSFVVSLEPDANLASRADIERVLGFGTQRVIADNVFWYAWQRAFDNPDITIWLLVFFGAFPILVVARRPLASPVAPAV